MDTIGLLKSVRFCIALWLVVWRSLAAIVRLKPSSTVDEIAACQRPADKKRRHPSLLPVPLWEMIL